MYGKSFFVNKYTKINCIIEQTYVNIWVKDYIKAQI